MKMTFKKITLLVLTLTLVFTVAACGGKSDSEAVPGETTEFGSNAIAELLNQGYTINQSSWDETIWQGILTNENEPGKYYLAEADMTADLYKKFDEISFEDEQSDEKKTAFITYLENATVTDISDKVPTQEQLDKLYVGKKISDLEKDGFENTGYTSDPDTGKTSFYYDGPEYCVTVSPKKGTKIDMDDMSANDIRKIKIASIEFQGLSDGIFGGED